MILVMSWRGSGIDWQIHSETVRLLLVMKRFLKCLEKQSQTKAKSSRTISYGVRLNVPRTCAEQLHSILMVPMIWNMSCIVLEPQKQLVKIRNDVRPVVLTPCILKAFEWAFVDFFSLPTEQKCRCCYLTCFKQHLLISSVFDTIKSHLFSETYLNMNFHASIITSILYYLTNRPQHVKVQSGRKWPNLAVTSKLWHQNMVQHRNSIGEIFVAG